MKNKNANKENTYTIQKKKIKQKIINIDILIHDNLCSKYFKQPNMGNYV